jgi:glutathione S-transferase
MADVILYHGLASTCSKKVRLALYEKGVSFDSRLLDLSKLEQREPRYLALNPKGVVPTLVHAGRAITESSNILEYIDEAFPGPALSPASPSDRSAMRLWLRFSDELAYPSIAAPTWEYMQQVAARGRGGAASSPVAKPRYSESELEDAARKMNNCIETLEIHFGARLWLVDETFTLADAAVLPFADRIRNLCPNLVAPESRPAVCAWLERAKQRPSFNRAIAFTEDPRAADLPNI